MKKRERRMKLLPILSVHSDDGNVYCNDKRSPMRIKKKKNYSTNNTSKGISNFL